MLYDSDIHPHPFLKYMQASSPLMVKMFILFYIIFSLYAYFCSTAFVEFDPDIIYFILNNIFIL